VRLDVGRIELIVPEKAAFQLEATTERGDAINDYGAPLQKESDGHASTIKGSVGSGPTVRLTANRGSVEVRKEGQAPSDMGSAELPAPPRPPRPPRMKDLKDSEVKM
jgi:hypothetical protein